MSLIFLVLTASSLPPAPVLQEASSTATLRVRILWEGELPAVRAFTLPNEFSARHPEEAAFCQGCAERGTLRHEDLEVDPKSRGVRNVAISLLTEEGDASSLPAAVLDNQECRFTPHVQFVPVGRPVTVKNSDAFAHNARILGRGNQEFWNAIIAPGRSSQTRPVVIRGTYVVLCDVHPWMKAWLIASRHSWCAVSDREGCAQISSVPAGAKRPFVLWHETLGVARLQVDLTDGSEVERTLSQRDFKNR